MLNGPLSNDPVLATLNKLIGSAFEFTFSGSRANREIRDGSDFDFIIQHQAGLAEFLEGNMTRVYNYPEDDFTDQPGDDVIISLAKKDKPKLDMNTHSVYTCGLNRQQKVDVCVVFDLDWRLQMIEYVTRNYSQAEQKSFLREDWNRMYELCPRSRN